MLEETGAVMAEREEICYKQVTLTGAEGKRLIALAAKELPVLQEALCGDRVLALIGGTTVSALSEALGFGMLRISGRVDASGTRTAGYACDRPHTLFIQNGIARGADDDLTDAFGVLGRDDLIVTSVNAFDPEGNAYMACAAPLGGERMRAVCDAEKRGVRVLILAGLNKLIPSLGEDMLRLKREQNTKAMGAAIELCRVNGELFTETDAFETLFGVRACAVAGGGLFEGEGSRVFQLSGSEQAVQRAWDTVLALKGTPLSGDAESLKTCFAGCASCKRHIRCIYKNGYKAEER